MLQRYFIITTAAALTPVPSLVCTYRPTIGHATHDDQVYEVESGCDGVSGGDDVESFEDGQYVAPAGEAWLKFQDLKARWRTERGISSSISGAAMSPAYQAIIGMGVVAVPFILETLRAEKNDPDHWFWALRAITGDNPVADDHRGDFKKMAGDWLDWADKNGW